MDTKLCCICNEVKPATKEFFHKRSSGEDGFRCDCKECRKLKRTKDYNRPTKICSKCKIEYPNDGLHFNNLDGVKCKTRAICRKCHKKTSRKVHLKRKYNITLENHKLMIDSQEGKCAICNRLPKRLVIDHSHTSGKIRGLLCDTCNSGLGMFKENKKFMENAIKYLEFYNKNTN